MPEAAPAPQPAAAASNINTASLISSLMSIKGGSDIIFSPGRPPQIELNGDLRPIKIEGLPMLLPEHTTHIAMDLIGANKRALESLKEDGSCDVSYAIPQKSRFRVNIFRQRGTYAIVMRVIPSKVPSFEDLMLPPVLREIPALKSGIVLVTGPTGSGKSSTLAAIIDLINTERAEHIVTIEDPIEFLHPHKKGTVHQRELHSDTPNFALALRAALRQAPKVILVGEMRDKDTIEVAMTAAKPDTSSSPRSTPSMRRRPSSASSGSSRSPTSRPSARASPVVSATSSHSGSSHAAMAKAAWRSSTS